MNMFQVNDLTYQYPEACAPALQGINATIKQGEFVLLLGKSGSGKSTFLRSLNGLVPRFYGGKISGEIAVQEKPIQQLTQRDIVTTVGFVNQDPERQLVLETVERELVFGMENQGISAAQMKGRLAEVSHLFGLRHLLSRRTSTLSGGEKQLIALAGVLTTFPQALLLDEPTSQLDPVHAEEVLHSIRRLNEEWGLSIVLSEHRVERCFHLADRIILFEAGRVVFQGTPQSFIESCQKDGRGWAQFLPPITRHFLEHNEPNPPLTVKEARNRTQVQLTKQIKAEEAQVPSDKSNHQNWWGKLTTRFSRGGASAPGAVAPSPLLGLKKAKIEYDPHKPIVSDLDYHIFVGDKIALLGENGAGKSTVAKALAHVVPLKEGMLQWEGEEKPEAFWQESWKKIGYLSQNPNDYLLHDTVEEEMQFAVRHTSPQATEMSKAERVDKLLEMVGLTRYRQRHPYDLSGGERQLLALSMIVAQTPDILLLDEPTRGLDLTEKERLIRILSDLPIQAVLLITHDVEFAKLFANRISILYQGEVVADGRPCDIFSNSFSYMPQVNKYYR